MGSNRNTTGGVSVPVGFRFKPSEEELVNHFLKKRKQDKNFKVDQMSEFDFYKYDPWDIPALFPDSPHHDMEWLVISPRNYKYINSTRANRTTPRGYWKITGKERPVKARRSKAVIGKKRTLTFYEGRAPNHEKTNWVMHEYDCPIPDPKLAQMDFVLCRLKKKPGNKDTSVYAEGEPSSHNVSNCEDQVAAVVTPESQDYSSSALQSPANIELGDVLQANGTNDDCNDVQSPFRDSNYPVKDKNDISTCDEGEHYGFTRSDFENNDADDMFPELCDLLETNMDSPLQLDFTQQSPIYTKMGDVMPIDVFNDGLKWLSQFVTSTASDLDNQATENMIPEQPCAQPHQPHVQAPIYTKMGNVLHDEWQFTFSEDDFYLKKDENNISTNDDDDQVSNTSTNFENQATDERISEVCPQPEENLELYFRLPEPQEYTLPPLMNT